MTIIWILYLPSCIWTTLMKMWSFSTYLIPDFLHAKSDKVHIVTHFGTLIFTCNSDTSSRLWLQEHTGSLWVFFVRPTLSKHVLSIDFMLRDLMDRFMTCFFFRVKSKTETRTEQIQYDMESPHDHIVPREWSSVVGEADNIRFSGHRSATRDGIDGAKF